jgi:hypothetical protein
MLRPCVSEEEVPPHAKVQLDPMEHLTQHNKCHNVEDPAQR